MANVAKLAVGQREDVSPALVERMMSVTDALQLAREFLRKKNYVEAVRVAQQVADHKRGHPDAFHILAMAAYHTGRIDKAIQHAERAVGRAPKTAAFWSNLSEMLRRRGLLTRALTAAKQAVALDAAQEQGWSNLAAIEHERQNFADAEKAVRNALKLDMGNARNWNLLGNVLARLQRDDEAHAAYAEALRLRPQFTDAMVNDALCWRDAGAFNEALKRLNEALLIQPQHVNAHVARAVVYFLQGDVTRGRVEYEWRLRLPEILPSKAPGQRWRGEDIAGKHLLLLAEQGLGDVIQACRYVAALETRGVGALTLHVPRALRQLLADNFPDVKVTSSLSDCDGIDFHCGVMSLPLLLEGASPTDAAPQMAYLTVPAERAEAWVQKFAHLKGRKIGLVWAGNAIYQSDHMRSMRADLLQPLLDLSDCHFFSLQVGPPAVGMASLKPRVEDLSAQVSNMTDAAAAIAALDLVISVDTSLAHLGGALGTEVWTMLPHVPDWRWGMKGDTHPLYATTKLFRQKTRGDWAGVVSDIRAALAGF